MLPETILPLLAAPGTDKLERLVVDTQVGGTPASGWLLDRQRQVVARLQGFRWHFLGFDAEAERLAAVERGRKPAELLPVPPAMAMALDDARLGWHGAWQAVAAGRMAPAAGDARLHLTTDAEQLTLRFMGGAKAGAVVLAVNGVVVREVELRRPAAGLPVTVVLESPGEGPWQVAMAVRPLAEGVPAAEQRVVLAGLAEHKGLALPVAPALPPLADIVPPPLAGLDRLLGGMPAEGHALVIGGGPGRIDDPRCIHLDWLAYDHADVLADPVKLPFRSGSLDVVHSHGTLNRVADPKGFMAEVRRVLKPGGQALIGANAFHWPRYGGPHLADFSPHGLAVLCSGFAECRLTTQGGPADRSVAMLAMAGADAATLVARQAGLRQALGELLAGAPPTQQMALAIACTALLRK